MKPNCFNDQTNSIYASDCVSGCMHFKIGLQYLRKAMQPRAKHVDFFSFFTVSQKCHLILLVSSRPQEEANYPSISHAILFVAACHSIRTTHHKLTYAEVSLMISLIHFFSICLTKRHS